VKTNNATAKLVWVDCEMTGLNPAIDELLEVAVVVTDENLTPLDGGIDLCIKPTAAAFAQMSDFVREMHTKSGLLAEIETSGLSLEQARNAVLDYVKIWVPEKGEAPLAGNSVGVDKSFLAVAMPGLIEHLHYRIIDVSTLKELALRWYNRIWQCAPAKAQGHRALQDILESITELKYYRKAMFVPAPGPSSTELKSIASGVLQDDEAADPAFAEF
jgi:oligoribonuclease